MIRRSKKTLLWISRRKTRKQSWVIITYLQLDMTAGVGDEDEDEEDEDKDEEEEEEDNLEGFLLVL